MKFPFQRYIVCYGKIYGSKIIGEGAAPSHLRLLFCKIVYINMWKELLPICLREKAKIAGFFLLSNFYFDLRPPAGKIPGQDRRAKTRAQGQLECAESTGVAWGDDQAWNWLIH